MDYSTLKRVKIKPCALGDNLYIREMTLDERDTYEMEMFNFGKSEKNSPFRARLLIKVLCNDKGERVFTDEDVGKIGVLPAALGLKLYELAHKLSGTTSEDIEALEKN
jgi:hypothetical protein